MPPLQALLQRTVRSGGEGLMLHKSSSLYRSGRSDDLIKLKTHDDAGRPGRRPPARQRQTPAPGRPAGDMPTGQRFQARCRADRRRPRPAAAAGQLGDLPLSRHDGGPAAVCQLCAGAARHAPASPQNPNKKRSRHARSVCSGWRAHRATLFKSQMVRPWGRQFQLHDVVGRDTRSSPWMVCLRAATQSGVQKRT